GGGRGSRGRPSPLTFARFWAVAREAVAREAVVRSASCRCWPWRDDRPSATISWSRFGPPACDGFIAPI
ncbi:hypothetical protein M569_16447, partial [Genlisea aurea]